MDSLQTYIEQAKALDPIYWIAFGLALFFLIVLMVILSIRAGKKRKAQNVAPKILLHKIQVAPLGKGMQLKFLNMGYQAKIYDLEIKKRHDIKITQGYKDYLLEGGGFYVVLCEKEGSGRADDGFEMILHYADQLENVYKQKFFVKPNQNVSETGKLVRYA